MATARQHSLELEWGAAGGHLMLLVGLTIINRTEHLQLHAAFAYSSFDTPFGDLAVSSGKNCPVLHCKSQLRGHRMPMQHLHQVLRGPRPESTDFEKDPDSYKAAGKSATKP